jgi:hypothetical protein
MILSKLAEKKLFFSMDVGTKKCKKIKGVALN